jgi:hypothetical protein
MRGKRWVLAATRLASAEESMPLDAKISSLVLACPKMDDDAPLDFLGLLLVALLDLFFNLRRGLPSGISSPGMSSPTCRLDMPSFMSLLDPPNADIFLISAVLGWGPLKLN